MTRSVEPENWQELDRLLDEALDLESPDRERFLDTLEPEQRAQVAALLERCANNVVDKVVSGGIGRAMDNLAATQPDHPGVMVGRWTIENVLGSGGTAQVFLGECAEHGYVQKAAVKVLWSYAPDSSFHQRFLRERSILASLNHPNIARFLDGGVLKDGRPWLAMEFVSGKSLIEHCRGLPVAQRVEVFLELCAALECAHSQLIIHRDIKPANVLVDEHGRPRLLDFGIARIMDDSDQRQITRTGASMLTLQYASPEQLADDLVGVPSDVYQMGALLFEMLTGRPVFDLKDVPLEQAITTIRETPAPAPSGFCPELAADLDAIVGKALRKEPEQRYASVSMLAEDLRHQRAGRPISARPNSRWYVWRRFLRRHRLAVGVSVTAALTIAALLIAQVVLLERHNRQLQTERDAARESQARAESMHAFVLDIFGSVDPEFSATRGKTIDDLVVEGLDRIRRDFADEPVYAAQLMFDMATLLKRRGKVEDAVRTYREVLALRTESLGDSHPDTIAVLPHLAEALLHAGQPAAALAQSEAHLKASSAASPDATTYINALLAATPIVSANGDQERALLMIDQAIDAFERLAATDSSADELLRTDLEHQRAVIWLRQQNFESAVPVLEQSVVRYESRFGPLDSRSLEARTNLAYALRFLKRPGEARQVLRRTLANQRELYGGPHWRSAYTLGHLANLSSDEEDYQKAIELWQESEAEVRNSAGSDHPWIQSARHGAARSMLLSGRCREGESILNDIVARDMGNLSTLAGNTLERLGCSR